MRHDGGTRGLAAMIGVNPRLHFSVIPLQAKRGEDATIPTVVATRSVATGTPFAAPSGRIMLGFSRQRERDFVRAQENGLLLGGHAGDSRED